MLVNSDNGARRESEEEEVKNNNNKERGPKNPTPPPPIKTPNELLSQLMFDWEKKKLLKDFPKNKINGINFKKISIFEGIKKNSQGCPRTKGFIFQKRISNFKIKMMERKFFKGHQKLMVFPFE